MSEVSVDSAAQVGRQPRRLVRIALDDVEIGLSKFSCHFVFSPGRVPSGLGFTQKKSLLGCRCVTQKALEFARFLDF